MSSFRKAWVWPLSRFLRRVADAHRHFGNEYSNRRDYELAMSNYTRAIKLDHDYAQALYSRGVLLWREFGDYAGALRDLTRVLELDPGRTSAYFNRAMACKMLGEQEAAVADLERYLERESEPFWLEAARGQLNELLTQSRRDEKG